MADKTDDSGTHIIIRLQALESLTRAGMAVAQVKEGYEKVRLAYRVAGDWQGVERMNFAIKACEDCFNAVANLSENDNGE